MTIESLDKLTRCRMKLDFLSDVFSWEVSEFCAEGLFVMLSEISEELKDVENALSAELK